jgi:hypothetical protein
MTLYLVTDIETDGLVGHAARGLSGKWVDWYLRRYLGLPLDLGPMQGERLFARSAIDLPSLIVGRLGWDAATLHKKRCPPDWLGAMPHSHRAEDDALGYARLLLTVLAMPVAAGPARPAGPARAAGRPGKR